MRSFKIGAAVAALALLAPVAAIADETPSASQKRLEIEMVGSVASVVNATTITVKVTNTSADDHARTIARAMRNTTVTLTTDTKTVIRRSGIVPLTSVLVGDKVSVKALCTGTAAPFTCLATRINAAPAKPAKPTNYTVGLTGAILTIPTASSFTMRASGYSDDEHGNSLEKLLHNQIVTVNTDTKTVITSDDTVVAFSMLTVGTVVKVKATCASATPFTCLASRISVVPPKRADVTLLGTLLAKPDATTLSIRVMNVSPLTSLTDPAMALLNQTVAVTTNGDTSVRRGETRVALSTLVIGESLMLRAKCTTTAPLTCLASRITAAAPTA